MSFCPHCGSQIEAEDSRFCEKCGGELPEVEAAPAEATPAETPAAEAPTEVITPEEPTEVMPAAVAGDAGSVPTEVMPAAVAGDTEPVPTEVMPAADGPAAPAPAAGKDRKKLFIIGGIGLAVVAAIVGGVFAYLALTGDSKETPKAVTVKEINTVVVDSEADPLEEPFTLKVATLDGAIPDDLVEMEYLLAEIEIDVDNGDVYGLAQRPATAGDGSVIQGNETSLEIKGTYKNGVMKGTWSFYRPYGMADLQASGEIESGGEMTRNEATGLLTGSFFTVYDDGQSDTRDLDVVTIYFKT